MSGDWTLPDIDMDFTGAELGAFFLLSVACVFLLLEQVNGKIYRLRQFLNNRQFHLLQGEGAIKCVNGFLKVLIYLFLLMPFASLAVWALAMAFLREKSDEKPVGGMAIFLVGLSFIFFLYGIFKIRWQSYRLTKQCLFSLFMAFACFTGYQFVATLIDTSDENFFGYSALFLSSNALVMILLIFMHTGITGSSMRYLLQERLAPGEPRDAERIEPFEDEIEKERSDMEYMPTRADVIDLFTVAKVSEKKMRSAFGGGIQRLFSELTPGQKKMVSWGLYAIALGILVIYAFSIYWIIEDSRLGFITMFAVILTDVILYFYYISGIAESATELSFTAIINRLFLFVFGGNYWIYGYMVLYLYYGIVFTFVIGSKRFPFEENMLELNLDNIGKKVIKLDLSKAPEFLMVFVTLLFAILMVVLYATEPKHVPLLSYTFGNMEFEYYSVAAFCVLIVGGFYCLYCTARIFIRKKRGIRNMVNVYVKSPKFDIYWIYLSVLFLFVVIFSVVAYWVTDQVHYITVGVMGSLAIILFLNALLHYVLNDYQILQNIQALNIKITKHNMKLEKIQGKVDKIKQDLQEGNTEALNSSAMGLAQSIVKQEKADKERKKQELARKSPDLMKQGTKAPPEATHQSTAKVEVRERVSEVDDLVKEEMERAKKDEEMYEGGSQEGDEEFDPDNLDADDSQKASKKHKLYSDWRNK